MFADPQQTIEKSRWLGYIPRDELLQPANLLYTNFSASPFFEFKTQFSPLAQEISISDYLDLIELAEEHETGISWYMGKLPLHTDVPEMFEDIGNAPNSPWRDLGSEIVLKDD